MNIKKLSRCLAVLPGAVFVSSLCSILYLIVVLLGDLFSGSLFLYIKDPDLLAYDHFFVSFILFAIIGYSFVKSGAKIAPCYKRVTALLLFAIIAIISCFLIFGIIFSGQLAGLWRLVINLVICIASSGFAAFAQDDND